MNRRARNKIFLWLAMLAILLASFAARADEKNHEPLWRLRLGDYIYSCPAIGTDGTIYTTVTGWKNYADVAGGKLAAATPAGVAKWVFKTKADIKSSPAIGADGTIYFGCRDEHLYAVRADGTLLWAFKTGAWVDSSPAIARDGSIYFGSWDGKFYALGVDGKKKWELNTGAPIDSSASIGTDGEMENYHRRRDHFFGGN
jgi:outer membrane protein assembly factor BamB